MVASNNTEYTLILYFTYIMFCMNVIEVASNDYRAGCRSYSDPMSGYVHKAPHVCSQLTIFPDDR